MSDSFLEDKEALVDDLAQEALDNADIGDMMQVYYDSKYATFDDMTDDDIREHVRVYSDLDIKAYE